MDGSDHSFPSMIIHHFFCSFLQYIPYRLYTKCLMGCDIVIDELVGGCYTSERIGKCLVQKQELRGCHSQILRGDGSSSAI
jgi:hypothetical protein